MSGGMTLCICLLGIVWILHIIVCLIADRVPYPFRWFAPIVEYIMFRHSDEEVCRLSRKGDSKWDYEYAIAKNIPIMKFDTFLSMYAVNPKKYNIDGDKTVKYDWVAQAAYSDVYRAIFTFSYHDWRRFVAWKRKVVKDEEQKQRNKDVLYMNEALAAMLQDVQKDIDALQAKTQQESKEAARKVFEVLESMGKSGFTNEQVLNALEHFCNNLNKDACGRGRSPSESSCSKARPTSPPQFLTTL